jgi:hypothetical protein
MSIYARQYSIELKWPQPGMKRDAAKPTHSDIKQGADTANIV